MGWGLLNGEVRYNFLFSKVEQSPTSVCVYYISTAFLAPAFISPIW